MLPSSDTLHPAALINRIDQPDQSTEPIDLNPAIRTIDLNQAGKIDSPIAGAIA